MVINQAYRLHPCVNDHRADEFEATRSERLREILRERGFRANLTVVLDRSSADHAPHETGQISHPTADSTASFRFRKR